MKQICDKYGYTYTNHTVATKDSYKLNLSRISGAKNDTKDPKKKQAVLMMHGTNSDMMMWVYA